MRWFKADLHLHTVLSPCGDLSMSPQMILERACQQELDLIAITDHNTILNCPAYAETAQRYGINFLYGLEVQTAEEIHVVTLFDDYQTAKAFADIVYESLLPVKNDPDFFGDQVVIDASNNIIKFEEKALINSSILPLDEIVQHANDHGALVFPAHVDAESFSIIGQLGMIPPDLRIDACGVTAKADVQKLREKFPQLKDYALIKNSDAHYPDDIGSGTTNFYLDSPTVSELKKACKSMYGRKVYIKS